MWKWWEPGTFCLAGDIFLRLDTVKSNHATWYKCNVNFHGHACTYSTLSCDFLQKDLYSTDKLRLFLHWQAPFRRHFSSLIFWLSLFLEPVHVSYFFIRRYSIGKQCQNLGTLGNISRFKGCQQKIVTFNGPGLDGPVPLNIGPQALPLIPEAWLPKCDGEMQIL